MVPLKAISGEDVCDIPMMSPTPLSGEQISEQLTITANAMRRRQDVWLFDGHVILSNPYLHLSAEQMRLDKGTNTYTMTGGVRYEEPGLEMQGDWLEGNTQENWLEAQDVDFHLIDHHAQGHARHFLLDKNANFARFRHSSITTCRDPQQGWSLEFSQMKVDYTIQRVIGRWGVLRIFGLPVGIIPYMNYTLTDRASGFLAPSFGSYDTDYDPYTHTKDGVFYFKGNYFWDIAPNLDNTISILRTNTGNLTLDNEFRYLLPLGHWGDRHSGSIRLAQSLYESPGLPEYDLVDYQAEQLWSPHWQSQLRLQWVNDPDIFIESPLGLQRRDETGLTSYAQIQGHYDQWNTQLRMEKTQPLLNTAEVYAKWPQWQLNAFHNWDSGVFLDVTQDLTQWDYWLNPVANTYRGWRLYDSPRLGYRWQKPYATLDLQLRGYSTQYDVDYLHQQNGQVVKDDARALDDGVLASALSVKSSLIFVRPWQGQAGQGQQTLTPIVQYVKLRGQDNNWSFPNFDTSYSPLSYSSLWNENRFTGLDRFGDDERLSYALETQWLDHSGRSLLKMGIGQQHYLQPREQWLTRKEAVDRRYSDLVSQQILNWGVHRLSANQSWHYHSQQINQGDIYYQYHWDDESQFKIGFVGNYMTENPQPYPDETPTPSRLLDIGWRWRPAEKGWLWTQSYRYDLEKDHPIDAGTALTLGSCCFDFGVYRSATYDAKLGWIQSFGLTLYLKGLTTFGSDYDREIRDDIGLE